MIRRKKYSPWMKGLLYAEQVGITAARERLYQPAKTRDMREFHKGIREYIIYCTIVLNAL